MNKLLDKVNVLALRVVMPLNNRRGVDDTSGEQVKNTAKTVGLVVFAVIILAAIVLVAAGSSTIFTKLKAAFSGLTNFTPPTY